MIRLNLPEAQCNIKKIDGKLSVFDIIRKKFVVLTPEEWVRQHFIHHLIKDLQYPKTLLRVEFGIQYNQLPKRPDLVVYDRKGSPYALVECKAPEVPITQKTFEQAAAYNQVVKAKYLMTTNGMKHYCCAIDHEQGKYRFLPDIPVFEG